MNLLVDTSVWIAHFKKSNSRVVTALEDDSVVMHPFILGELAMGSIPDRRRTLSDLSTLHMLTLADQSEVLDFVTTHKIHDKGIGWVDANLIFSARVHGCDLVTYDKKLANLYESA